MFLIVSSYHLNTSETDDKRHQCFKTLEEAQEAIKSTPPRYYDEYTIRNGEASLVVEVKDIIYQTVDQQVSWESKSITVEELTERRNKIYKDSQDRLEKGLQDE